MFSPVILDLYKVIIEMSAVSVVKCSVFDVGLEA